jgi:hypothetical protein
MAENHKPKDVLDNGSTLLIGVDQVNKSISIKFSHYIFIFIVNLILLISFMGVSWYAFGRQYLLSIENRLSATITAKKDIVQISEIKELKNSLKDIQQQMQDLKSSIVFKDGYDSDYLKLQKRIDAIQLRLDQKKLVTAESEVLEKWKDALILAIKMGQPLDAFRKSARIPEDVREKIDGIDFIPTYKNISEEWGSIRDSVRLQTGNEKLLATANNNWWGNFKVFVKKMFRIQRLDKNNLTPEETFVRHVDKLFVEQEIEELIQWIEVYQSKFDDATKQVMMIWGKKLEKFRQGQLILEMVKKY